MLCLEILLGTGPDGSNGLDVDSSAHAVVDCTVVMKVSVQCSACIMF